jgi:hypothetical protein
VGFPAVVCGQKAGERGLSASDVSCDGDVHNGSF